MKLDRLIAKVAGIASCSSSSLASLAWEMPAAICWPETAVAA